MLNKNRSEAVAAIYQELFEVVGLLLCNPLTREYESKHRCVFDFGGRFGRIVGCSGRAVALVDSTDAGEEKTRGFRLADRDVSSLDWDPSLVRNVLGQLTESRGTNEDRL